MPLTNTALIVLHILIAAVVVVYLTPYIARAAAKRNELSNPGPAMYLAAFLLVFWVGLLWPIFSLGIGLWCLFNLPKNPA